MNGAEGNGYKATFSVIEPVINEDLTKTNQPDGKAQKRKRKTAICARKGQTEGITER